MPFERKKYVYHHDATVTSISNFVGKLYRLIGNMLLLTFSLTWYSLLNKPAFSTVTVLRRYYQLILTNLSSSPAVALCARMIVTQR
jgi:hypothetical protein